MDQTNRHPLDCITSQSGLSMLECLIPLVDYPLKLPLALFIKFNEILMIINTFQSMDSLKAFGLDATANSPTDLLCALTGISPDMINLFMNTSSLFSNNDNNIFSNGMSQGGQNTNINSSIADIFAQYDMEQKSEYSNNLYQ